MKNKTPTLWQRFCFSDLSVLLKLLKSRPLRALDIENLPLIQEQLNHSSHKDYPNFKKALPQLRQNPLMAVIHFERRSLWKMFFIQFGDVWFSLFGIYCAMEFLKTFHIIFAVGVFCFNIFSASLHAQKLEVENLVWWRISTRCMEYIYEFSLSLSRHAKEKIPTGDTINLAQSDLASWSNFLGHCFVDFFVLITTTFSIFIFLWLILGHAALGILLIVWMQLPIVLFCSYLVQKIYARQMKLDDHRMGLITEWIAAMRLVRYFNWSVFFARDIKSNSQQEFRQGVKKTLAYAMAFSISHAWWMVVASSVCAGVIAWHATHMAATVFTSVWLIGILGNQLTPLPWFLNSGAQSLEGNKRLKAFFGAQLQQEEFDLQMKNRPLSDVNVCSDDFFTRPHAYKFRLGYTLNNVEMRFENQNFPIFSDVSFQILPGTLTAVVGSVGCGKSVLLQILMGELIHTKGSVFLDIFVDYPHKNHIQIPVHTEKGLAFLRQQQSVVFHNAHILSATVAENITLFQKADPLVIEQSLQLACFSEDLAHMPFGLDTMVGEHGISLSGGQQQRLALARCHFAKAPILFLDDPLSAVDVHTEKTLAEVFLQVTPSKTIIWTTHRATFLPLASRLLVFEGGTVVCK